MLVSQHIKPKMQISVAVIGIWSKAVEKESDDDRAGQTFLFLIIGNNQCPDSYKQNLRNAKNGLINLANANRTRY